MYVTTIKALGEAPVRQALQRVHHTHIKRDTGHGIINSLAVNLGRSGHVVERFGTPFDLQRVDTHLGKSAHMLNRAQILGVHNVSAVLVFKSRHILIRPTSFLEQENVIAGFAHAECWGEHFQAGRRDHITTGRLLSLVSLILPAAGVGTGSLVRISFVDVAREQAAA